MTRTAISVIGVLILLLAAIPYVARARHPEQRRLAAYLVFVSVFAVTSAAMFVLLATAANALGLGELLERSVPALVFLVLVFVPALLLARWQARKPPWRHGPPP